jgi:hypothetical protein
VLKSVGVATIEAGAVPWGGCFAASLTQGVNRWGSGSAGTKKNLYTVVHFDPFNTGPVWLYLKNI